MGEGLTRRELAARAAAGGAALALPGWLLAGEAGARPSPALRELRRQVKGPMLMPRNSAGLVFNSRYAAVRPMAVVQAVSAADVQACVRWAARRNVPIRARSGGHSYASYSTVAGGLVVDLRRLNGVSLSGATVSAGAGTHLIDLYAALARRGATVPGGTCPTVALGGLALGGGMGLASRRFGLTCDNVTAMQIVTADGRVRWIDSDSDPDLFWACRGGGGGNFGIVTQLRMRARRVSSASWFRVTWPWSQASEAIAAWQAFAPHAPPELTSIMSLAAGGSVSAQGQFFGSESALRRLVAPLTRVDGANLSTGSAGYLAMMQRWAGCAGESIGHCDAWDPQPFAAASDYVATPLSAAGRRAAIGLAGNGGGTLLFDAYGGAINRVRPASTAFVHRDQLFCIQYYSGSASASWVASARRAMRPYTSGQSYQNYIDPDQADWRTAYYGANLQRLGAIKAHYDPDGLFRFPQAI
ncbi:MAG TPA: FAD-binding oxidoreductase [Capillimicrobium sp.]|nr:FAD-binding oxidoreductase [Capillimicrobium sp.]